MPDLLNTTDFFGVDNYPIGVDGDVRQVTFLNGKETEEPIGKPNIPTLQIFDYYAYSKNESEKPHPPTLPEMTNMSWQALALGARGLMFYSFYEIIKLDK